MNYNTETEFPVCLKLNVSTFQNIDIDMLSGAGIPVYTTTGHGGGIHLLDNFVLKKSLLSEQAIIISF